MDKIWDHRCFYNVQKVPWTLGELDLDHRTSMLMAVPVVWTFRIF